MDFFIGILLGAAGLVTGSVLWCCAIAAAQADDCIERCHYEKANIGQNMTKNREK